MPILAPLPDAVNPDRDDDEYWAYTNGATVPEYLELRRTNVLTLSMRVKWWWRRTRRVLR